MQLHALHTQALRYLALGDYVRALRLYDHVLRRVPTDQAARMRVADICVQVRRPDLAQPVYAAVAFIDLRGGRPLHALVAMQALSELGQDVAPLRATLVQVYGAGSPHVGRVGGRLAPPAPDTELGAPVLPDPDDPAAALQSAVSVAAHAAAVVDYPPQFQPVPLLSELTGPAFARVLEGARVHRLGHGSTIIRAGERGDTFFLIASGQVRVHVVDRRPGGSGGQLELARLHEGAIVGEMALINAEPRTATVEVVGSADVIAFGRDAIEAAAGELPAVAAALDRFTRERLVKNVLATSPLFHPFTPAQRLDLVQRFSAHEVPIGTDVIVHGDDGAGLYVVLSGEVQVLRGEAPFEEVLARLGPGEVFGEISLIRRQPAMATVRASRRSSVLFLAREYFERLLSAVPEMRAFFEQLTEARLSDPDAIALGSDLLVEDDDQGPFGG